MQAAAKVIAGSVSQWSLTFEVRKRRLAQRSRVRLETSQWSLTFEVRKSWASIP